MLDVLCRCVEPLTQKWLFNTLPQLHSSWTSLPSSFSSPPSLPLSCRLHLFAFTLRSLMFPLPLPPSLPLWFLLVTTSLYHIFSPFQILTPDSPPSFSFLLPLLFFYLSQPVGCVIVQWRWTDRVMTEVMGTGWGSTQQVLTYFSPV